MDVLKRELQRKRQQLDADFGGRKVLRRAEIEAREVQRLRVAEQERLLQKKKKEEELRSHPPAAASSSSSSMPALPPAAVADVAKACDDRAEGSRGSSPLPREEVIRRLRLLRRPATLFGEDDAARLRRLHDALEDPAAVAGIDAAEIGEGQTNDFLRDIQAPRARAVAKPKAGAAEKSHGASEEKEEEVAQPRRAAALPRCSTTPRRRAAPPQLHRAAPPHHRSALPCTTPKNPPFPLLLELDSSTPDAASSTPPDAAPPSPPELPRPTPPPCCFRRSAD